MPGVEKLEEVEGLTASDFAKKDTVGPMTEGCLQQITDGYCRQPVLRLAGFQADQVGVRQVDLRSVLDQDDALVVWYEPTDCIQHGGFAAAGTAADENVLS